VPQQPPVEEEAVQEARETETEIEPPVETIEVEEELSDGAIQEARRKTKEVVKKEGKARKVKKQEEDAGEGTEEIAKEKVEKFNEA
jgi:hypothetical protein